MVFLILLVLLTVVPLVELTLLYRLYEATDLGTTLLVVIGTGVLGAALARRQGFALLNRIRTQLSQGKPPTTELLDGAMILFAGAVLLTPGMITDAIGFLLLTPPVRAVLRGWLGRRLMARSSFQFTSMQMGSFSPSNPNEIEAEYTVETGSVPDPKISSAADSDPSQSNEGNAHR